MMSLLLALVACSPEPVEDTAPADTGVVETDSGGGGSPCDEVSIHVQGDDPPAVGDEWMVYLWCDEALMTGAMVVYLDPADFAQLEENRVTFFQEGEATLHVQVGSYRADRPVKVLPQDQ